MLDDAQKALVSRDYAGAARLLSAAIKNDPQNALAYQYLAFALYKIGDLEAAKRNCEITTKLNPNLPLPWVVLSYLSYKEEMDIEKSSELAQKAYALAPNHPEVLTCLGFVNLLMKEDEQAVRVLEEAVSSDPRIWDAWNNLSIAYMHLGKRRNALRATFELFKQRPSLSTGIWLFASFMALREIVVASRVMLFASIFLAIWFNSPAFLLFLVFYAFLLLPISVYSFSRKAIKAGVMATTGSLLLILLAWLLDTWLQ
jgi:tetratricopeptide (TPR) repeat protein